VLRTRVLGCVLLGSLAIFAGAGAAVAEKPGPQPVIVETPTGDARPAAAATPAVAAPARPATDTARPAADSQAGRLTVAAALDSPTAPVHPGEPLAIRITLHNAISGPLMVPDWDHVPGLIDVRAEITGYPASSSPGGETVGPSSDGAAPQKGDLRELPPGDTVVLRTLTPMLPGRVHVIVGVNVPPDGRAAATEVKPIRPENVWTGQLSASVVVDAAAEESPAIRSRYEDCRARLADPQAPAEQKVRLLAQVADEKHYWAADFIRDQCDALPQGPLRDAAFGQLLRLAKVGTAYESIPLLVDSMTSPRLDPQVRAAILDWTVESLIQKGRLTIAGQAAYQWPEVLQKEARDEIVRLRNDRNADLAALARDALLRLNSAEPR